MPFSFFFYVFFVKFHFARTSVHQLINFDKKHFDCFELDDINRELGVQRQLNESIKNQIRVMNVNNKTQKDLDNYNRNDNFQATITATRVTKFILYTEGLFSINDCF